MIRVYVAGAYSAPDVMGVLGNMRRGLDLATQVLEAGFAPFTPWLDYHFALRSEKVTLELYKSYSMAWLKAADAVLVVREGHRESTGTQAEIEQAKRLNIPVFFDLHAMCLYFNRERKSA